MLFLTPDNFEKFYKTLNCFSLLAAKVYIANVMPGMLYKVVPF